MLNRLFPRQVDNRFDGHRAALWLLGLYIALKLVMGFNSIFNTAAIVSGPDGIPLDSFGPCGGARSADPVRVDVARAGDPCRDRPQHPDPIRGAGAVAHSPPATRLDRNAHGRPGCQGRAARALAQADLFRARAAQINVRGFAQNHHCRDRAFVQGATVAVVQALRQQA